MIIGLHDSERETQLTDNKITEVFKMNFSLFGQSFHRGLCVGELKGEPWESNDIYDFSENEKRIYLSRKRLFGVWVNVSFSFRNDVISEIMIYESTGNSENETEECRKKILGDIFGVPADKIELRDILVHYDFGDFDVCDLTISDDEIFIMIRFNNEFAGKTDNDLEDVIPVSLTENRKFTDVLTEAHTLKRTLEKDRKELPANDVPVEHHYTAEKQRSDVPVEHDSEAAEQASNVPVEHQKSHDTNMDALKKLDELWGIIGKKKAADTPYSKPRRPDGKYKKITVDASGIDSEALDAASDLIESEFGYAEITEKDGNEKKLVIYLTEIDFVLFNTKLYESELPHDLSKRILTAVCNENSYLYADGKRRYIGPYKYQIDKQKHKIAAEHRQHFYIPERYPKWKIRNNELPESENNKIVCADSLEYLRTLPDKCIDIVVTAPPTDFGFGYDDTQTWEEYLNKIYLIFLECIRVLKFGGRLIADIKPMYEGFLPLHYVFGNALTEEGMLWKGEILWDNGSSKDRYISRGSWGSPSTPRLWYTWELIEIFAKGDIHKSGDKTKIDITGDEYRAWTNAKWDIPLDENTEKCGYDDVFPEELVSRLLKLFSYKGDVVLDPFNGVGTTTAVAKRIGRRYLGIDISGEYCLTAKERLEEVK